jgi:ATP-dependent DNA ligase
VYHPPAGLRWLHEIKHDGFRILARKHGDRVTVWSRRGSVADHDFVCLDGRRPNPAARRRLVDFEQYRWRGCELGLEGIVAKRACSLYRSGPSRNWLKTKNPDFVRT